MIMVASTPTRVVFAYPGKPSWCVPDMCELILPRAIRMRTASPPCRTWPTPWERRRRHRTASTAAAGLPAGSLNSLSVAQIIA